MKVIQINTFSYKAAGNIMMNLHRALLNKGVDSYVVWGRGRKAQNEHEYYMDDDLGVKIHGAYTRLTDKTGFASVSATRKLLKWIDNINPDIIHLHCIHGYYINIELLFNYIKKKNIRVVWTQHDCWAFTGHCAYFDACGCEKWKTGCYDCEQIHTYPISYIDNTKHNWKLKKKYFGGLDAIIVSPCNWLNGIVNESFLNIYESIVIYNGIDTDVFNHENSYLKKERIVLGIAGEWTKRKGLEDFLKLRSILSDDYKIVLVGLTDKQINALPKGIIGICRTENTKKLVEIYRQASILFNPTYEDNFPTINLEALACGTPVITYDTGGGVECIDEGKNGYIVSKGDINKAAELIIDTKWKYPIEFNKSKFSKNSMIRIYIELYENL